MQTWQKLTVEFPPCSRPLVNKYEALSFVDKPYFERLVSVVPI